MTCKMSWGCADSGSTGYEGDCRPGAELLSLPLEGCDMLSRWYAILAAALNRSGLLPAYLARQRLAARYLRGSGLEIGAMEHPLKVPTGVHVTYVDYMTKEENLSRYPGLNGDALVSAQLIEDGFTLASVADASQDFLIANHVLEHATNPIQALITWDRVLKDGGIMFISVPNGRRCFDMDRPVTTLKHLQADYDAAQSGDAALIDRMNREHYREWETTVVPRLWKAVGVTPPKLTAAEKESRIESKFSSKEEIHYHVFSRTSLTAFLAEIATRYLARMKILRLASPITGTEFIVIAQKQSRT